MKNISTALTALGISTTAFEKMRELAGVESASESVRVGEHDLQEEITLVNKESACQMDDESEVNLATLSPFQMQLNEELQQETRHLVGA